MSTRDNFRKFRLVMWKNVHLLSRNKRETLWTFLLPVVFVGLLVLVRYSFKDTYVQSPAITYPSLGLHHRPDHDDFPIHRLAYYPKKYKMEMDIIGNRLNLTGGDAIGFDSLDALDDFLVNATDALGLKLQLNAKTNTLAITLKASWMDYTETFRLIGPDIQNYPLADGGRLYYRRGFTYMQQLIFETFVGEAADISITLNRYPVQPFVNDFFLNVAITLGPLLFTNAFYTVYLYNLKNIIHEKESQLKEMMLIMGLPNWVDWLAWFTKIMLENIPISILIVLLLKVPFVGISCVNLTSTLILWLIITIFIVSLSTFSMMVSTFFKNSKRTNLFGGLLYFAAIMPTVSATTDPSTAMSILGLVLTPSAFGFALRWVFIFEEFGLGMQWRYLFTTISGDATFPLFYYLISMLLMNIVHILIMLYVEGVYPGDFGSPKPWYFPIQGLFSKRNEYIELGNHSHSSTQNTRCEQPPADVIPGIVIAQLTKRYGDFAAVNHLSLTINENEIMVLLGENGAGKSTTMSMLTGVIPPTAGTAFIYEMDIRTGMTEIRNKIGLCPQRNVLFHQLTVLEHLLFFGQLKGLSYGEAFVEANGFMRRLGLAEKKDALSQTLSGGMMRKLNLAISLAGKTKAVFLDEPTSGVDPASRRDIWKILQEEKQHRMILLSTHFMDEADVLGDRVAILQHGELKCSGSAFYLKTLFHSSYKLTCVIKDGYHIEPVMKLIRQFVPDVTLKDNYGAEYHFDLNPIHLSKFGDLFKKFESSESSIGLASYGIELPDLEDVFLKIQKGSDEADSVHYSRLDISSDSLYAPVTGSKLHWNWFKATVKKKHYYNIRNPIMFLIQIFLPTIWLGFTLLNGNSPTPSTQKFVNLSVDTYGNKQTILIEGANSPLVDTYKNLVTPYGTVKHLDNINDYIQSLDISSYADFKYKTIIGAKFMGNNSVLAMFNNQAGNAIPIALTTIYNAVIKSSKTDYPQFKFIYEPFVRPSTVIPVNASTQENIIFSFILAMSLIFETALMGAYYVTDRSSGALSIQFISGMSPILYWIYSLLMDLIPFSVSIASVIILYVVANVGDKDTLGELYLIMLLFGLSVLPFIYMRARRFKNSVKLFTNVILHGFLAIGCYLLVNLMRMNPETVKKVGDALNWIFLVHPSYNLLDSVVIYVNSRANNDDVIGSGLWKNFAYFVGSGAFFMFILIIHDMQLMNWLYRSLENPPKQPLGTLEADVQAEMERVDAMTEQEINSKLLVAKHLKKSYWRKTAVQDVTFVMNRGECLGLLGKNGAGKTTTFKMLTGEETIRYGDAWLNGVSIKNNLLRTYSHFGYCPQVDAIMEDLTGIESMEIIALVRGIPSDRIEDITKTLAFELGFDKHMKKSASQMSGGNRRKLCTALALMGTPAMVYMDEPTTGMDPSAKRCVWNVVGRFRQSGHSIILTTHSMEECEALCTRLAILKNGKLEAIATGYNLKQKYAKTGHLVIQLERSRRRDQRTTKDLERFLPGQLQDIVLKQEYQGKLEFEFNASEKMSKVFNLMESIKTKYNIESYAVSNQNSLDNVFLEFVADS